MRLPIRPIFFLPLLLSSCEEVPKETNGKKNEAYYRDQWAIQNNGETEVRLPDGTRCDVETSTHAVEIEWANKWYEGFGQSLWYGFQLNKKPGIVLILRKPEDQKFVYRIQSLAYHQSIDLDIWTAGP
jgi:hypothetical protein